MLCVAILIWQRVVPLPVKFKGGIGDSTHDTANDGSKIWRIGVVLHTVRANQGSGMEMMELKHQ